MRFRDVFQRQLAVDRDLNDAGAEGVEELVRRGFERRPLGDIGRDGRAGGEERALMLQERDRELGGKPDDWPKDTHMPKGFRQSSEPGKVSLPIES